MKRFYTLLASAAILFSAAQAQNGRLPMETFTPGMPQLKAARSPKSRVMSSVPANATWEAAGTGYWMEGLLDQLIGPLAGSSWEVSFEEAKEYPGYYRLLPYSSPENPVSAALETVDATNYVYINATNPSKVYIEDFFAFDYILISNLVAENEWTGYKQYGQLKDGVITFPNRAFAYATYDQAGFDYCDLNNVFQIALPGYELKDYTLDIDLPVCAENNTMPISITRGSDIATVKVITAYGYYSNSDSNNAAVAANGAVVDPAKGYIEFQAADNAPAGLYTTLAVGLNDSGAVVAARCAYSHILEKDDADWKNIGTATMTEAILITVYETATQQLLTCPVEECVSTPGRYRLVNPYAEHTWSKAYNDFLINHDHPHYIYINATDPSMVYIEPAPLGINSDGEASLYSYAAYFLSVGEVVQNQASFGKMIVDDGEYIISMPDGSLMFSENNYDMGAYHAVGSNFMVVITPDNSAVEEVEINDENLAPAEYYNLQGIRMAHPRQGQLVIERRGSKVTKTIVK